MRRKESSMRRIYLLVGLCALLLVPNAAPAVARASLTVVEPKDGASISGKNVTVRFTTSEITLVKTTVPVAEAGKRPEMNRAGQGHLHFVLDLQPLVVWEQADPYSFADVPPGEHQLMVELVENDHSSFSPRIMQTIRFRTTDSELAPVAMPATSEPSEARWPVVLILAVFLILGGATLRHRRA
jgi:hypothetical protein